MSDAAARIHELLDHVLPRDWPQATLDGARGEVVVPVGDLRSRVSTRSLIASCNRQPPDAWAAAVDAWVDAVRAELAAVENDDEVATEQLRVRVRPRLPEAVAEASVTMPFGSHLDAVLVADRAHRIRMLTPDRLSALNLDTRQAVRLALRQTVRWELSALDIRDHDVGGAGTIRMLARDGSPYVTTALLSLPRFTDGPSPHGVLVSAPRYSAVMLHRVRSGAVRAFAGPFTELTRATSAAADDPCTSQVFWWHDGTMHPLEGIP
jgi:hypothetical protein